ncbi:MAG: hypothetical protein PHE15_06120 [Dehalococcoidales bacterium]|nr:hypothetical protein [Dehalococcoidales bacterium]
MKKLLLSILLCLVFLFSACNLSLFGFNEGYIYSDSGAVLVGGDGKPIKLINNDYATNPTYSELKAFVLIDTTNTLPYVMDGPEAFVCSDFAEELHNNAEEYSIRAGWVSIDYADGSVGHAINVFETTDMGLVFIDCTGELVKTWNGYYYVYEDNIDSYADSTKWDTVACLIIGEVYGHIGIADARSLDYQFYLDYIEAWETYKKLLAEYNAEVQLYNLAIAGKTFIIGSKELTEIQKWESDLNAQEQLLIDMEDDLGDYYYLPFGIVANFNIYW